MRLLLISLLAVATVISAMPRGGPAFGERPNGDAPGKEVRGHTEGPEHQFTGHPEDHTGRPKFEDRTEVPYGDHAGRPKFEDRTEVPHGNHSEGQRGDGPMKGGKGPEGHGERRGRSLGHQRDSSKEEPEHQFTGHPEDHTGRPKFEDRTEVPHGDHTEGVPRKGGKGPEGHGERRGRRSLGHQRDSSKEDPEHQFTGLPEDHTGRPKFEDRTEVPHGDHTGRPKFEGRTEGGHDGARGGKGPEGRGGQKPEHLDHAGRPEYTKRPEVTDHTDGVRPGAGHPRENLGKRY
jgi:hypothetical protein